MNNIFQDPNQEVEFWKDAFYHEFKDISSSKLADYFEKEADRILQKNNIKSTLVKKIKETEFAKT